MIGVAIKGLLGRKLRATLTAFAIVLGVAMISGAFILTDTLGKSFDTIFNESYKATDAVISSKAVVGSDTGSEAPAFGDDVLSQVQSKSAPLLGDRVAEQAHLLGLIADLVGNLVVVHDLELARDHHRPDEVSGGVEDVPEVLVTDFCVGDWVCHASFS